MVEKTGIQLRLRPVMPMMMRGVSRRILSQQLVTQENRFQTSNTSRSRTLGQMPDRFKTIGYALGPVIETGVQDRCHDV